MIKNRALLLKGIPRDVSARRKILLDVVDYVLAHITPDALLKGKIRARDFSRYKRIAVIALGKASEGMLRATLHQLKRRPNFIVQASEGHPLPTIRGVSNTERIIRVARSLTKEDCAIVLMSGGGSAMLASPVDTITLDDKIKVTNELLRCGGSIQEINTVRKHLSKVKGGYLAELLYPAAVFGFVLSDVVGNDLSTIASGPLSPDPSTFADAISILKKYHVAVPPRVRSHLESGRRGDAPETPKPGAKYFDRVRIEIIGNHRTAAEAAYRYAEKRGIKSRVSKKYLQGEAKDAGAFFAHNALKNGLTIACGETTVTCRGKGNGGRNQEFVLGALSELEPNQTIVSVGTDGVDGMCPEKIAGALGDGEVRATAGRKKLNSETFLKNNDSYAFFRKAGGQIKTGATGTNLGDLVLLYSGARTRRSE